MDFEKVENVYSKMLAHLARVMPQALARTFRGTPSGQRALARRYPEQGQRQTLRRFRRAQGGPGIVLEGGRWKVRGE